jgi:predicted TIM-barrel fold metal-dependent hydrolase
VKILDAHCHSGPSTGGWLFEETGSEITIAMKKQAQRVGITRMFVSHFPALFGDPLTGNREVAEELGKDDMFKGYFVFNPHYYKKIGNDVLDSFFRDDFFIGFKLLPSYWEVAVTDERYNAVWEYADQYRLPVLVHTWQGQFDEPSLLEKITRKYKNAFFLLGHSGGNDAGRQQAVSLAQKRKNVYLEFCGSFGSTIDWIETIKEVGFDRVVFGSDAGMHDQAWEIGRLLSIPLPDIKLRPVLGENFLKILKKRTFRASGVPSKLDCLES